jgi:hypothetical protein
MAAKRDVITYSVADIAGGGAVRIATRDSAALNAVHMFLAFQRHEHHAN